MKNGKKNRRVLIVSAVLLILPLLASCGLFSAVRNNVAQPGGGVPTATSVPTAPIPSRTVEVAPKPTQTPEPAITPEPTQTPEATDPGADATPAASEAPDAPCVPILERGLEEKPISLINGRLFIRMPEGTVDNARRTDIMSDEMSGEEETRLVLEGNGQQLVVLAQETFFYSKNMEKEIAELAKWSHGDTFTYSSASIRDSRSFKAVSLAPEPIDAGEKAVLIREAYVRVEDGTLITVGVYVTPETFADRELCIKQADKILESLSPGDRKLNVAAHDETMGGAIRIHLDKNFVLVEDEGVDFIVFYITKVVSVGDPIPSIGIYVGDHPSFLYLQRGIDDNGLTKVKDTILHGNVEWITYRPSPGKEDFSAEAAFYLPNGTVVMHIFVDAADEAEFLAIKDMIDTMDYK